MLKKSPCGSSSVGRASASQAEGHGFESRLPLIPYILSRVVSCTIYLIKWFNINK